MYTLVFTCIHNSDIFCKNTNFSDSNFEQYNSVLSNRDGSDRYEASDNNNDDGYEAFDDGDHHVEVGFHGDEVLHNDDFHQEEDFGFEGDAESGDYG